MTYTLAADGTSDKVLLSMITWTIKQHAAEPVVEQWVDYSRIPRQPDASRRLIIALDLYPCDVLFVHRDAEAQSPDLRRQEIAAAMGELKVQHIPVIPIRMTEAWLLADESAIRSAAGNPNGTESLDLPDLRKLESLPDPKTVLHAALIAASGLNRRRRSRFDVSSRVHQIPNYIDDYSPLLALSAFRSLQDEVKKLIAIRRS